MNIETVRNYCLQKADVTEELPFGPDTLVFKTNGKIFALLPLDAELASINLKCNPEKALELRENFEGVIPGFHMNKKHWNTIYLVSDMKNQQILDLIDHSYDLVKKKKK